MLINLTTRSYEPELMDDLDSSGKVITQTLQELNTVNKLLGGNQVSIEGLGELLANYKGQEITLADLGCGGGDILILMAKWARKKGIELKLIGIDANPNIVAYAQQNCAAYPEISFRVVNIFSSDFQQQQFDIIHSSLFTHHFTDEELTQLFTQFKKQVRIGVLHNDLHRHWFAYYAIKLLTQFLSKSEMVRHDAALSVARAFTKEELKKLLLRSGYGGATIAWRWAFRWKIVWKKG